MARNSALNFNLPSADDLFSTEEERAEARLEKVVNLSPSEISDFPNHPFKVRMDAAMQEMTESVKQYGVLVPTLVRPKPEGGYEMVAGHRRKKAADLAGLAEIPCIVRQLTDDEATIIMVDSNLQREQILPSEKAFAYKMKLDAMKRQQGERTDLTSATPLQKLAGKTSRQILAEQSGESHEQIRKYIRLTHLIPEILELVDNSVLKDQEMLQIALSSEKRLIRLNALERLVPPLKVIASFQGHRWNRWSSVKHAQKSFSTMASFKPILSAVFLNSSLRSLSESLAIFLIVPFHLHKSVVSYRKPNP